MPFLMQHFPMSNGELIKQMQNMAQPSNLQRYPGVSPFSMSLDPTEMMEFENQVWHHKDGTDWIILSDFKTNEYIKETLELIENELAKE
jgi:RimJ/RimL family protein N-acetyltransferase